MFTNLHCNEILLSPEPGLEDGGLLGSLGGPGAPAYSPTGGRYQEDFMPGAGFRRFSSQGRSGEQKKHEISNLYSICTLHDISRGAMRSQSRNSIVAYILSFRLVCS